MRNYVARVTQIYNIAALYEMPIDLHTFYTLYIMVIDLHILFTYLCLKFLSYNSKLQI